MITQQMYKDYLYNKGENLSEIRKQDATLIVNMSFTEDVGYKRVYILDPKQGWIWTDSKYSKHSAESILKDAVDYYLEFRPFEHHPIGTYVFIPNDSDSDIGFYDNSPINPFNDLNFSQIFSEGKLWMIVGKNDGYEFVKYQVLKCNWKFQWIAEYLGRKKIFSIYGSTRVANSYTSGTWSADYGVELDTISMRWLPNTYYIFGEEGLNKYNLDDSRYLELGHRMMITTNNLHPQCWKLSKIIETEPVGILKLTMQRDEYNPNKDDTTLMLCDYYDASGGIRISNRKENNYNDPLKTGMISFAKLNENSELEEDDLKIDNFIYLGHISYFICEFSYSDVQSEWKIEFIPQNTEEQQKENYYTHLLKLNKISENSASVKVNKANSLLGKKYKIIVHDKNGDFKDSMILEVAKYETT